MNYEKKYKEAQGWIEKIYPTLQHEQQMEAEAFFPELKESENERIRKAIINVFSTHKDYEMFFGASVKDIRTWLEKQGEQKASYTTIAETGNGGINALVTGELSNSCDYEEKPVGKVEPKFKVKYAGSEYNVLEIKEIAGDTYYGIEDEPNHIDYVLPDNCEIVSEQKSDWSEEDDDDAWMNDIISKVENNLQLNKAEIDWLKSLKTRYTWKPSDEQMKALLSEVEAWTKGCPKQVILESLYNDLKKLKG